MTLFILIPSPRFPGTSLVDSAWSLKEQPDAPTLAAERVSALVKAGQSARVETSEIRFLPPVVGCASNGTRSLEASGDALPECTPKAEDSADAVSSDWVRLLRIARQAAWQQVLLGYCEENKQWKASEVGPLPPRVKLVVALERKPLGRGGVGQGWSCTIAPTATGSMREIAEQIKDAVCGPKRGGVN